MARRMAVARKPKGPSFATMKTGPAVGKKGMRTTAELTAIAAAAAVVDEVKVQFEENGPLIPHSMIAATAITLPSKTSAGWRALTYYHGLNLRWAGGLRASTRGELLFEFKPVADGSHGFINDRNVEAIEIGHTQLATALGPTFDNWFRDQFGDSPANLIERAKRSITPAMIGAAGDAPDEEPVMIEISSMVPGWGSWA
jgi:hypothetical protein